MTIDQTSAEEIVAAINKASAMCNKSLKTVMSNESLGHVQVYGRLAGNFLGHSYMNILAPIWKALPNIEPSEMKAPYVEPEPTLSAESKAELCAFVTEARAALVTVKRLLPTEETARFLNFGGLPEVEQAVADIEEFLANPRFRDEGTRA